MNMAMPETTFAEAFERYVGGKCLVACRSEAWRDIKAWVIAHCGRLKWFTFTPASRAAVRAVVLATKCSRSFRCFASLKRLFLMPPLDNTFQRYLGKPLIF